MSVRRRTPQKSGIRVPLRRRGLLPLLDSDVLVVIGLDSRPKVRSRREGVARPFDEPVWFPGKRSARQIAHKNRRRRQENESFTPRAATGFASAGRCELQMDGGGHLDVDLRELLNG